MTGSGIKLKTFCFLSFHMFLRHPLSFLTAKNLTWKVQRNMCKNTMVVAVIKKFFFLFFLSLTKQQNSAANDTNLLCINRLLKCILLIDKNLKLPSLAKINLQTSN